MAKRKYNIDYDTDYHKLAQQAAESGNWDEFDYNLTLRDLKIGQTGEDYGTSTSSIRHELETKYGRYPQTEASDPLGFYKVKTNEDKAEAAMKEYEEYSYDDYLKSDEYKALEEQYTRLGEKSMEDTLGQASARTGGLASSYAVGVSRKKFDEFMYALTEVAADMYGVNRDELMERVMNYKGLAKEDYEKYQDARNFAYSLQSDRESKDSEQSRLARAQVDALLENGKMPTEELITKSGYSQSYIDGMLETHEEENGLNPAVAQTIYDTATSTMEDSGINIPGMLTYDDWLKVQNDPEGEWQQGYGVTKIGYELARDSKTYSEYAESFMEFMSQYSGSAKVEGKTK